LNSSDGGVSCGCGCRVGGVSGDDGVSVVDAVSVVDLSI